MHTRGGAKRHLGDMSLIDLWWTFRGAQDHGQNLSERLLLAHHLQGCPLFLHGVPRMSSNIQNLLAARPAHPYRGPRGPPCRRPLPRALACRVPLPLSRPCLHTPCTPSAPACMPVAFLLHAYCQPTLCNGPGQSPPVLELITAAPRNPPGPRCRLIRPTFFDHLYRVRMTSLITTERSPT